MTAKAILALLLLFSCSFVFAQNNMPVGTWRLISGKMTRGDSTISYGIPDYRSMKIVTATHFSVIGQNSADSVMRVAIAGRVTMEGNKYTEIFEFASSVNALRTKSSTFTSRVEGNKWYIRGGMGQTTFDEVWEKVQ